MSGRLTLIGTPIGNLGDVSERMGAVLAASDVIACEDTRRARKLLSHLGIRAPELVVYSDATEHRAVRTLMQKLEAGRSVALLSDAGMPGLSDPGYRLVSACIAAEVPVDVVPGPSAAVTALAISGLPPARFVFEGFLPRKGSDRRRRFAELVDEPRTIVFYESPHRIQASMEDLLDIFGPDRQVVIARELTKMYEEVRRGTVQELTTGAAEDPPRGEIVLVVAGAVRDAKPMVDPATLAARAKELMDQGLERREAMSAVAKEAGVPRREVFDALLED